MAETRTTPGKTDFQHYEIAVVSKALRILQAFREKSQMSLQELAAATELPKSSVFRLVVTLEAQGFLMRSDDGSQYLLGSTLLELGLTVRSRLQLRQVALPYLAQLARDFNETANLAVLKDGEALYVDIVESTNSFRFSTAMGSRDPLHASSVGKAMSAYLPWSQVETWMDAHGMERRTDNTITSRAVLKSALEEVRQRGYALDDEEAMLGVRCVGAPVLYGDGVVAGAISLSGPAVHLTDAVLKHAAAAVTEAARSISHRLGFRD